MQEEVTKEETLPFLLVFVFVLRSIPHMHEERPGDAVETVAFVHTYHCVQIYICSSQTLIRRSSFSGRVLSTDQTVWSRPYLHLSSLGVFCSRSGPKRPAWLKLLRRLASPSERETVTRLLNSKADQAEDFSLRLVTRIENMPLRKECTRLRVV